MCLSFAYCFLRDWKAKVGLSGYLLATVKVIFLIFAPLNEPVGGKLGFVDSISPAALVCGVAPEKRGFMLLLRPLKHAGLGGIAAYFFWLFPRIVH